MHDAAKDTRAQVAAIPKPSWATHACKHSSCRLSAELCHYVSSVVLNTRQTLTRVSQYVTGKSRSSMCAACMHI